MHFTPLSPVSSLDPLNLPILQGAQVGGGASNVILDAELKEVFDVLSGGTDEGITGTSNLSQCSYRGDVRTAANWKLPRPGPCKPKCACVCAFACVLDRQY